MATMGAVAISRIAPVEWRVAAIENAAGGEALQAGSPAPSA